eukprot:2273202-Pleurochrysis_carterae.AAC.4
MFNQCMRQRADEGTQRLKDIVEEERRLAGHCPSKNLRAAFRKLEHEARNPVQVQNRKKEATAGWEAEVMRKERGSEKLGASEVDEECVSGRGGAER